MCEFTKSTEAERKVISLNVSKKNSLVFLNYQLVCGHVTLTTLSVHAYVTKTRHVTTRIIFSILFLSLQTALFVGLLKKQ